MPSVLPFDELNRFNTQLREDYPDGRLPQGVNRKKAEMRILDELLDLFLLAYARGREVTAENLAGVIPALGFAAGASGTTQGAIGGAVSGTAGGGAVSGGTSGRPAPQQSGLPSSRQPTLDEVMAVVDKEVAGKTWEDRVREHFDNGGTVDDIVRIAETETHRVANTSAYDTAKEFGATQKTWVTMLDDRVRETHDYLEGITVGIDDEFITFDGDSAYAPGLFSMPENNINCRCELIFS